MFTAAALVTLASLSTFDSGSDGSDGSLNVFFPTVIDLSQAPTGNWSSPSPSPGKGVYDPNVWAVVFKYTTINVQSKTSVTFINHPSGAPVIWLATGDVYVGGSVSVNGASFSPANSPPSYAAPGPGGFAGGVRELNGTVYVPSSAGFGPGGGAQNGVGQYGNGTYGNVNIIPLIGGSGGGGSPGGGGAGGGAILIASSTMITVDASGSITADGGSGSSNGGSGGSIRLVANSITGQGQLRARPGSGGGADSGRIRLDADVVTLTDLGIPLWTTDFTPMPVFPSANAPTLRIVTIGNQSVTSDPGGGIQTTDVTLNTGVPVSVSIVATNVPVNTIVVIRVVPARGAPFTVNSTPLAMQQGGILTATAILTFPPGKCETQLRAYWGP